MRCASCGFENPSGIKFCGECGAPLKHRCSSCGFENPPGFKFCGECANPLIEHIPSTKFTHIDSQLDKNEKNGAQVIPIVPERKAPEAERRQLTVMFCDIVGSATLSEQLDPEELRDVMQNYQEVCSDVITHYDGHIAKYLGDGVLAYFGYPLAHEDDAQRAVRAGLEMVEAIHELPLQNKQIQENLQVRLGIHTGLVVVGEMGAGDVREKTAVVGETPNVAARLQEQAETNSVVVSSTTHRLIQGFFDCRELGPHTLKGFSQPLDIYLVLKETDVKSRLDVAITKGLTPLVGREQEVQLLLERWEQVKEGMGQVVFLSGEAGIGKSRLLQVLTERLGKETHTRIENRCSSYYQNSSLYPVIDHFHRLLRFAREDSSKEKLGKLEQALGQYGFPLEEMVPIFATLLSLPIPDNYPPLNLTPQRLKQKTFEALLSWLLKEADQNPVLRIVEDLHWVDPSTLEYLGLLIEQVPTVRVFTLLTFRPDFIPPWAMRSHMTQITLSRLSNKQIQSMVDTISGGKALPDEVAEQLVAKTDGIPLFVEELTKMVLESDLLMEDNGQYKLVGSLPSLAIPTTLQDSLMARLDRLDVVKEVAQLGATLGREFTYELLQAISPVDEETLQRELSKLVEAEILYQRGIHPKARYFFKHALIQEAAYESLLRSKRHTYHQKIAEVLENRFPETFETQPELLAHHYTVGGLMDKAIPLWHKAGQRAIERSAHVEAISHLNKGLELLETLPDTPQQIQQELTLQITLSVPMTVTKGYAAPEVGRVFTRARELCLQAGETTKDVPVLRGLAQFYRVKAELKTARELAEELLTLAQSLQNSSFLLEAHLALGEILFWLGDPSTALDHVKQGFTLYSPQEHRSHAFVYVQDPGMSCCGYSAWTMWLMGYPDQALTKSNEAMTLAQQQSHPYSLAIAHVFSSWLHQFRRESKLTLERADKLIEISAEQGFPQWLPLGNIMRGWALIDRGEERNGIEDLRGGIAARRARGSEIARTFFLALLADAYRKVGKAEEGITLLAEAIDTADKNGERFYQAELYRLKGEQMLALAPDNQAEAETSFRKAIDIASQQSAKSLELRATTSLSRVLKNKGKKDEARQMLAEIYEWFTEGFETTDLKEAKSLLEELS
ncbi:AAA family ATPase [Desulfobacterota bacterium AH_259_B03_O07]|nr:AAA family ATPase [Desulfobacterota bacterium AH_259_B03_O07]